MIRHKYVSISASASGETLVNALAGLGERKRRIKTLTYVPDFSTTGAMPSRATRVRAYRNQDQIVDVALSSFAFDLYSNTSGYSAQNTWELDLPLEKGDGFKVGLYNAGATPGGNLQFAYEDQE